jgi:hypothetical protein
MVFPKYRSIVDAVQKEEVVIPDLIRDLTHLDDEVRC